MAIRTYVTNSSKNDYPRLMIHDEDNCVYLFVAPTLAIPLNKQSYSKEMDLEDIMDWDIKSFRQFDGAITLEN